MTNDLFRDLLDNRIPGHETPMMVWVNIMPEIRSTFIPRHQGRSAFDAIQQQVNKAYENLRMAAMGGLRTTFFTGEWIDYGWRRGLTGLERTRFNDAVEKMARANLWTRDECAVMLGKIMDVAEKAELEPLHQDPPADPRARALWAKQQQGHGPAMTPLRVRGRTTHYKEKR